jgi:threonine-phosphate decarboxylase
MGSIDFSHGGNIYAAERKYKKKFLDFSANINPLGLSSRVKEAIYKNFNSILHYPDPEAKNITRKIAQYWGIKEENVLVGNGSAELIYLVVSAFKPKVTLIPVPTFSEYERAARCIKSRIYFLRLKEELGFKLQDIKANKADILFLCNPNNPTGNLIFTDFQAIERLPVKLIVIDEAFMDFLPDEKKHSLIRKAQKDKRIIVLRTLTKFFAFPGLRIGYLAAHRSITDKLREYKIPWSVNSLAQAAGEIALKDRGYFKATRSIIKRERDFLSEQLKEIRGLKVYPSVANFLLIKIKKGGVTSDILAKRLLRQRILVRNCSNFRNLSDGFIRIAVRKRGENQKLIEAIKNILIG